MPPRLPLLQCMRAQSSSCQSTTSRTFTTSSPSQASTVTQRRRKHDPYFIAQAKARKAANLSRQEVLKKERAASLGDPIRGVTTPFVQSFDTATMPPADITIDKRRSKKESPAEREDKQHLNFFLTRPELERSVERSKYLSSPPAETFDDDDPTSGLTPEQRKAALQQEQDTAEEALRRITDLSIGNSKDRMRVNVQRCISTFGRHSTDEVLPPKPGSKILGQEAPSDLSVRAYEQQRKDLEQSYQEAFPRIGKDTGSSEVQIAILTAKIRALADFLQTRGTTDKMNKRNLRLLVHRRQKLLQYLRRSDRGGARWQHCIETLGLTEGTWRGEISL